MTISYIKCHFAIYKALAFNDLIWILQQLCEVDGSCYQPILQLRKMRVAAEENEGRRREGLSLVSALLPELGTRTEMQVIWFSVQFSVPWTIRSLCPEMVFPNLKKKKSCSDLSTSQLLYFVPSYIVPTFELWLLKTGKETRGRNLSASTHTIWAKYRFKNTLRHRFTTGNQAKRVV